jgi:hypothetical protein
MSKDSYRSKTPFAVALLVHLMEKEKCRKVVIKLLNDFNLRIREIDYEPYFDLVLSKRGQRGR